MNVSTRKINPFDPDNPVNPDRFAGREAEIRQIKQALNSTNKNKAQHILVQGDRWIGKSSISLYARNMARMGSIIFKDESFNFFTSFCRLGSCRNLNEICICILDSFKHSQNSTKNKIFAILDKVQGLQIGPFGIQLSQYKNKQTDFLIPTFGSLFETLLDQAKDSYRGFLFIIDETEHISGLKGVASFLKNLFEQLHGDGYTNVMFLLTAAPEGVHNFIDDHASFPRLFRYVHLPLMNQDESKELVDTAIQQGQPIVKVEKKVMESMHHYSGGFPGMLQELGFAAFEVNNDRTIDWDDFRRAMLGIPNKFKGAIDTLNDKYFRRTLTKELLSDRYRDILRVFGSSTYEVITVAALKKALKGKLKPEQVGPYLGVLVKRGILNHLPGKRGEYKLSSRMLSLWLRLEEIRKRKE